MNEKEDVQLVPFFLNVLMIVGFITLSFLHFYFEGLFFHLIQSLLGVLMALYWFALRRDFLLFDREKFWVDRFLVGAGIIFFGIFRFFIFDTPVSTNLFLGLILFAIEFLFFFLIWKILNKVN